jgi:hypothetical protein
LARVTLDTGGSLFSKLRAGVKSFFQRSSSTVPETEKKYWLASPAGELEKKKNPEKKKSPHEEEKN